MDVHRFIAPEKSGKRLFGIVIEDETTLDLLNIGEGRPRQTRWKHVTMARLQVDLDDDKVEFIALSERAARHVLKLTHGLAHIPQVRAAAQKTLDLVTQGNCPTQPAVMLFNGRSNGIPLYETTTHRTFERNVRP